MNEIEQIFYGAYLSIMSESESSETDPVRLCELTPQVCIGLYRVDFTLGKCVIEIDGHESHKTKEQREYDYQRERYLLKRGYVPVRFTGTEVFLQPRECVIEAAQIAVKLELDEHQVFTDGVEYQKQHDK